jgi:iron complex outermembrane receptor protein
MSSIRHALVAASALVVSIPWAAAQEPISLRQARAETPSVPLITVEIPAQSLERALQTFSAQSGLQVIFPTELTQGLTSPALEGSYTPEVALNKLLENSDLRYSYANPRTIAIRSTAIAVASTASRQSPSLWERFRMAQVDEPPASGGVSAESASAETQLAEVVVTAEKRSENIQRVPIAVTAVSGEALQQQQIFDPSQLTRVAPSLQYQQGRPAPNFFVRGVGTAILGPLAEADVATVIDDVTMARPHFMAAFQFFDLDHIEVLRGPQGMLFGKNAAAGLINVVTAKPVIGEFSGLTHLSYGRANSGTAGNEVIGQAAVNFGVSENSALRVSAFGIRQDGFMKNNYRPDQDLGLTEGGLRIKYLWRPGDNWEVNLGADYAQESGPSPTISDRRFDAPGGFIAQRDALAGVTASPDNLRLPSNGANYLRMRVGGAQATVNYSFGNGFTLTDIAAYRGYHDSQSADFDRLPDPLFDTGSAAEDLWQVSNELRLTSPLGKRLDYQLGLYYLHVGIRSLNEQFGDLVPLQPAPPAGFFAIRGSSRDQVKLDSKAVFGQARFAITDDLHLVAGARLTSDKNDFTSTNNPVPDGIINLVAPPRRVTASDSTDNFSYRAGAEYNLSASIFAYYTHARGYKGVTFDRPAAVVARPEIPTNDEVGLKATLLDRKLMLNFAIYQTDFKGFQAQAQQPGTNQFRVLNAGNLRSKGVEMEFRALPFEGLSVDGGATYNSAKYQSFRGVPCYPGEPTGTSGTNVCLPNGTTDASGNPLAYAPRWAGNLSTMYERPVAGRLQGFVQATYYYRSKVNFVPTGDPLARLGGYGIAGASIGVETDDSHWRVSLFARNLADKRIPVLVIRDGLSGLYGDNGRGGDIVQSFASDSFRTIGLSLDAKF